MKKIFISLMILYSSFAIATESESEEDIARLAKKAQAIIAKAKKDWPESYSIQMKQIEWEMQAMKTMDSLSKKMKVPD